ncbi:MAG TPA: peptidylprolyl isomerase [Verrucomicrobiales bacterium]|nr:peptidylprolyl isomerase [Verrucomicrobiales bacterium]
MPQRGLFWRTILYSIAILWLAGDLFLFHGPLHRIIHRRPAALPPPPDVVATVNSIAITRERLDAALEAYLRLGYRKITDETPASLALTRRAVLLELVHTELLLRRMELSGFRPEPAAPEGPAPADSAGAAPPDEEQRLALWIESQIASSISVSEEEIAAWFAAHADSLQVPGRTLARHLFLSTARASSADQEERILAYHQSILQSQATLEDLARQHSEDDSTRDAGGLLPEFTEDRMPLGFVEAVDRIPESKTGEPFSTSLGWHLVEVVKRFPPQPVSLEDMRGDIRARLESEKRRKALDALIAVLRAEAEVLVFEENLR